MNRKPNTQMSSNFTFLWKCGQFCAKSISLYLLLFLRHPLRSPPTPKTSPPLKRSTLIFTHRQLLMPFLTSKIFFFSFNSLPHCSMITKGIKEEDWQQKFHLQFLLSQRRVKRAKRENEKKNSTIKTTKKSGFKQYNR